MARADDPPTLRLGSRVVGAQPTVVGVLTRMETLTATARDPADYPCHLYEMRLGEIDPATDWESPCARLAALGRPVLATLRNQREGGWWIDNDPRRRDSFQRALALCAAVDVEWQSALRPFVTEAARTAGKPVVYSIHDFACTPTWSELLDWVEAIEALPNAVVKIATRASTPEEIDRLAQLLNGPRRAPRCVIAMGETAADTRVRFAQAGSCLAYGWLDQPTAPGQPSCRELLQALHCDWPSP
jgi:3-dehydroquinate dehydratase-1